MALVVIRKRTIWPKRKIGKNLLLAFELNIIKVEKETGFSEMMKKLKLTLKHGSFSHFSSKKLFSDIQKRTGI
jgi:hypothetical protein